MDESEINRRFPLLVHLASRKDAWLSFIQEYFTCSGDVAKQLVQCILSVRGKHSPDHIDRPDWLPHLDAMQREVQDAVALLKQLDPLYQDIAKLRPDANTFHIYLGELESRV